MNNECECESVEATVTIVLDTDAGLVEKPITVDYCRKCGEVNYIDHNN